MANSSTSSRKTAAVLDNSESTSITSRHLTADHHSSSSGIGGRRTRGRSMSARKPNELRPHVELSPKQGGGGGGAGAGGGSVRMRRTSDTVSQIGQLRLTPAQISLVRKIWQNVRAQGENGAGLQILRDHLFFRYPDIRDLFATGGASSETNYHKRLMTHAEALGGLLDEVIANLEQTHLLREKIRDLGRLHAKYRDIGFKASYWDRLAEAFNECTLSWCQKAQRCFDAQVAMTSIVMFIIEQLKDGYMEECRRVRRSMYDSGSRERKASDRGDGAGRSPRHLTPE